MISENCHIGEWIGAQHNSNFWFFGSEKALGFGMVMTTEVLKETGSATRAENIVIMRGFSYFSMEWVNTMLMHDAENKN